MQVNDENKCFSDTAIHRSPHDIQQMKARLDVRTDKQVVSANLRDLADHVTSSGWAKEHLALRQALRLHTSRGRYEGAEGLHVTSSPGRVRPE